MEPTTQLEVCGVWEATRDSAPPDLPLGAVHLWRRSLQTSAAEVDACHELLSGEERETASRFLVERPRTNFILTRGTLRSLLARYLSRQPEQLSFRYAQNGKPFLGNGAELHFNVSHCDGLALLGFVRKREIGVDVEKLRPQNDARRLAERFFSVRERRDLRNLSGDKLHAAFFRCWTRKEAYIKATGDGLSLPLHQFDVSIDANCIQALLATRPDPSEARRWTICDISTIPGYAAAFAVGEESDR